MRPLRCPKAVPVTSSAWTPQPAASRPTDSMTPAPKTTRVGRARTKFCNGILNHLLGIVKRTHLNFVEHHEHLVSRRRGMAPVYRRNCSGRVGAQSSPAGQMINPERLGTA